MSVPQHNPHREAQQGSKTLSTRLGPVAWRSSGDGPTVVFFAGALANGDLSCDVVAALEDGYRCITIDLPLGAHAWPLSSGADRSATSLARLLLDCLELIDAQDATVVANDTAGGLLLLSLATGHPALERVGALVLTNCESYEKFPPGGRRSRRGNGRLPPATPDRRRRRDPAFRPAGPADLGRLMRLLPHHRRATARIRFPPSHADPRPRSKNVGPNRQSGRRDQRDREFRTDTSAVTIARTPVTAEHTRRPHITHSYRVYRADRH
jgi:hypothetical protein